MFLWLLAEAMAVPMHKNLLGFEAEWTLSLPTCNSYFCLGG